MGGHVQVSSAVRRHYEQVQQAGDRFFSTRAPELASACWGMARRFHAGGRLFIHGEPGASFSDAQHNAVEFIHPVLVGKRALPAVAVRDARWLAAMAQPRDIRMQVRPTEMIVDEQAFQVDTDDAFVGQEILETAYHELWELVHVFFEHEGLLAEGSGEDVCLTCGDVAVQGSLLTLDGSRGLVRTALGEEEVDVALIEAPQLGDLLLCHGGVAIDRVKPIEQFSQEFYPFLTNEAVDAATVLADVARSVVIKWEEVAAIRRATSLDAVEEALTTTLKPRVQAGATVLTFGNGGSATDAATVAALFTQPVARQPALPARSLVSD